MNRFFYSRMDDFKFYKPRYALWLMFLRWLSGFTSIVDGLSKVLTLGIFGTDLHSEILGIILSQMFVAKYMKYQPTTKGDAWDNHTYTKT